MPLILAEMEFTGVKVDQDRLLTMKDELAHRLEELEKNIHELAGEDFNINSPKQLGVILLRSLACLS